MEFLMKSVYATCVCLAFVLMAIFFPTPALAQKPYFEGKTLTIVVGTNPGGIYDRYARLIGRSLSKHLPGNPSEAIQNRPGGGHITATNYVYGVAKPDGQTLLAANPNISMAQLTQVDTAKFDVKRFHWIGATGSDALVLTVRSDLPYRTFDDMRKSDKPIRVGTTGPGSATHDFPALLAEFLGANFKFVPGYPSTREVLLALERNEVDVWTVSYTTAKPFIERGVVRAVIRDRGLVPGVENIPVDEDLAPTQLAKVVLRVRSLPGVIGRPYAVAPGTPMEVVSILRQGFQKAIKDPELQKEAEKSEMPLGYTPGEEVAKSFAGILDQPANVLQEITKYVKF
jgi:tripartite-type tricarboxylate transporter receptor subunit TctC